MLTRGVNGPARRLRPLFGVVLASGVIAAGLTLAPSASAAGGQTLVADWELNEPANSTTMVDAGPNHLNGTIDPAAAANGLTLDGSEYTWSYRPPAEPPVQLPRVVQVVPESNLLDIPDPSVTQTITFRFRTSHPFGNIMQKGQATDPGGQIKIENPGGYTQCVYHGGNKSYVAVPSPIKLSDNQWHTFSCVHMATQIQVWVDNVEVAHKNFSTGYINNSYPFVVGGKTRCDQIKVTCDYYSGQIDWIHISNTPSVFPSAVPTISTPQDGSTVCRVADAPLEIGGSSDPGAKIALYAGVSTTPLATTTADGNGKWSDSVALANGSHILTATADDGTGSTLSPPSAPTHVSLLTRKDAHLRLSAAKISPRNHDGTRDAARLSTTAPTAGAVQFAVVRDAGVVAHSTLLHVTAGQHVSWTWRGRDSSGTYVPSASYLATLTWTQTGCTDQQVTHDLVVDNVAPSAEKITQSLRTFYPRRDDAITAYRNTIRFTADKLSEPARASLRLYRAGAARLFRTVALGHVDAGGSASYRWNGRRADGSLARAGNFAFAFVLRDGVGNVRVTRTHAFTLSDKHLVARTARVQRHGVGYANVVQANSCGMQVSSAQSAYRQGVLLTYCGHQDSDVSLLDYVVTAPRATLYVSEQPYVYGDSASKRDSLPVLLQNFATGDRVRAVAGPKQGLHMLARQQGSGFISPAGRCRLIVGFTGPGSYQYDIRDIGVKFVYGVLV